MDKLFVPIQPFEKDGITHGAVVVMVDYSKRIGGPEITFQAVEGVGNLKFSVFGSPRGHNILDKGWRTNNKKKLVAAKELAFAEISARSGMAFVALGLFLKTHGMELSESVLAATV